ncbi:MAG: putative lipid II flippase FtsW [Elusimicrobia bacterium CG08_land_8_20_14_0_20_59_10]|nr:MAG: putative lipid II flippase FtsW [Elusimicrobia bacterium CG08_land_8_20_14_0_20_59_10]
MTLLRRGIKASKPARGGGGDFARRRASSHNTIYNRSLKYINYPFFFIVMSLLLLGAVSLFSASAIYAENKGLGALFYTQRQALWMLIGLGFAVFAARTDLERLRRFIKPAFAATAFLLLLTLFMPPIANVRRWIPLGFMKLQMSEFAKIAVVLYLADFIDRNISAIQADWRRVIKPFCASCVIFLLIAAEPDLGTPALLFVVMMFLFFTSGIKLRFIMGPLAAAVFILLIEIFRHPYRLERMMTFMSPIKHAAGAGYQLTQSLLAVGSGGWFGKGLGASKLKLLYLPEAHTDFIFSIMAEEMGLAGGLLIVGLFTALLVKGARIARNAPSLYTSLAAFGLTLVLTLQAFFNISMAIGLLPTKGIPLPFFSYGGSSILASLIMTGIILNISAHRSGTRC